MDDDIFQFGKNIGLQTWGGVGVVPARTNPMDVKNLGLKNWICVRCVWIFARCREMSWFLGKCVWCRMMMMMMMMSSSFC